MRPRNANEVKSSWRTGSPGVLSAVLKAVGRRLIFGVALASGFNVAALAFAAVSATTPGRQEKNADPGPIKPIIDGMQRAGARLKRGDTGPATRTLQEKVVNDLQKLIDASKPKSRGGSQQPESGSRRQTGTQNRSQPEGNSALDATGEPTGAGQPGRKSGAGKPTASEKKTADNPQHPLLREVWGHLPPVLRERAPSDFHETILPAYDDLVRRYFEALLDGSSRSGPSRPVPLQSPTQGPATQGSPAQ